MAVGGSTYWLRGLLPIDIAMGDGRLISKREKTFLESAGNGHRPMTSAGTAQPDIHIAAAFSFEERNEECKEAFHVSNERDGVRIGTRRIISLSSGVPGTIGVMPLRFVFVAFSKVSKPGRPFRARTSGP